MHVLIVPLKEQVQPKIYYLVVFLYESMVRALIPTINFVFYLVRVPFPADSAEARRVISSRRCGPMTVPASSPVPNPDAKGTLSTEVR